MGRILLAEDDTALRGFLQRALEQAGHEVEPVSDGRKALPLLTHGSFDLLLTDIVMPEMDGMALAKHARSQDPGLKIVFITGFSAVAMEQADSIEPAAILSKPFHLNDAVNHIGRLMGQG